MRHCERVHRCKGIAAESRCGAKVKDRTLSIISRGAARSDPCFTSGHDAGARLLTV